MAWLKCSISTSISIALYDQYIQIDIVPDTKLGSNLIFDGSNLAGRHGLIGPHRLILVYISGEDITQGYEYQEVVGPSWQMATTIALEILSKQSASQLLEYTTYSNLFSLTGGLSEPKMSFFNLITYHPI